MLAAAVVAEVPFYASLKADEVNMRAGPGKTYPIIWVYHRRHLPILVLGGYEHWWRVADPDGEVGWVHKSLVSMRRTALLRHDAELFSSPRGDKPPLAILQRGVVGFLKSCVGENCRIAIGDVKGWLRREALWGAE